jgi:hypothetical protein
MKKKLEIFQKKIGIAPERIDVFLKKKLCFPNKHSIFFSKQQVPNNWPKVKKAPKMALESGPEPKRLIMFV